MPNVRERLSALASRASGDPVVTKTVRSTIAATLAYIVALNLTNVPAPLLAPLTALLVVQVTLYGTLTSGLRRVSAVCAGVTVASVFSALVGLHWWSIGLLILSALVAGRLARAQEFIPEAAISAMLVLSVVHVNETAIERIFETLIGAAVGMVLNTALVPPVWVETAGEDIEELARRMRVLLLRLGSQSGEHRTPVESAEAKLLEARRVDLAVAEVDISLSQAEDSLRLNPRVKEGLLTRVVLRTGLDTLEICAVILRTVSRTLADLAAVRRDEPLFPPDVSAGVRDLLIHLAGAVDAFAILITSQVAASAEEAEGRLIRELEASQESRDRVAFLLLERVQEHPRQWQLHGSLLAEVDRMLNELDVDKRTTRLAEELDRYSREQRSRLAPLRRWSRRMPFIPERLRRKVLG